MVSGRHYGSTSCDGCECYDELLKTSQTGLASLGYKYEFKAKASSAEPSESDTPMSADTAALA